LHASSVVGHVAVGRSRSPRHPRSVRATHGGIERRHEPPRRLLDLDRLHTAHVLVRLAVGDENEFAVVQVLDEVEHAGLRTTDYGLRTADCGGERREVSLSAIRNPQSVVRTAFCSYVPPTLVQGNLTTWRVARDHVM